ncbi:MAG: hypothetical protein ACRDJH_20615, partial [Thermomicrobiales bacterium]
DGLAQGLRPPQPTLDENLARVARRVQATTIAPPPRPAFGRDLRRSLLTESAVVPAPTGRMRRTARRLPRPTPDGPMSRWRPAVEFAVMVCLIVAVFGGIRAGDRLWPIFATPDDGQYIAVGDTTPAPVSPDEDTTCQTPPRTFEEIDALAATPVADPFDPIADSGGTRAELESVHGILRTLEQIQACAADGDLLAVYANFSDRFIRRHLGPAATADTKAFQEAMADPPLVRWPPAEEYVSIDDLIKPRGKLVLVDPIASLLGDGRVRAIVGVWLPTNAYLGQYVVLFAPNDHRWLIDEVFETELQIAGGAFTIQVVEGGLPQVVSVPPEPVLVATPATAPD